MIILRQREFANKANKAAKRQRYINKEIARQENTLNRIGGDIFDYQRAGADTSRLTEQYNQVNKTVNRLRDNVGIGAGNMEAKNGGGAFRDLNNYVFDNDSIYQKRHDVVNADKKRVAGKIREQKDKFKTKEGYNAVRETVWDNFDSVDTELRRKRRNDIGKSRDIQNEAIRRQRSAERGGQGRYVTDARTGKKRYVIDTPKATTESRIANLTDTQKARLETLKQQRAERAAQQKPAVPAAATPQPPAQPVAPAAQQPTVPVTQQPQTQVGQTQQGSPAQKPKTGQQKPKSPAPTGGTNTPPSNPKPPTTPTTTPKPTTTPNPKKSNYGKAGAWAAGTLAATALTYAGVKAYQHHKDKKQQQQQLQ